MRGLLKTGVVLAPALARAVALEKGEISSLVQPSEGNKFIDRAKDTIPSALITLHLPESDDDTTSGDLVLRFDINEATEACGSGNVLISGQALSEEGSGSLVIENDRLIDAAWNLTCVTWNDVPQEQLLSLNVDFVDGRPVEDVGFTVRFQQVAPVWISDVEGAASMTRLHSLNQTKPDCHDDEELDIDAELAELDYLRWQMHELRHEIFARERRLAEAAGWEHPHGRPMMVEDCDNLRCVARALFHKVKGAALSFYTGDQFPGHHGPGPHGPGPHGKGPKGPGAKHHGDHRHHNQSPGEFSFGQHEHHGNHTKNGTHPHPPQHGHPPPFCRCAPPPPFPPHGGPPHGGPHGGPPGDFPHPHHGSEMGHHGMEYDGPFSHSREGPHGPESHHHHDFAPKGHNEKHGHEGSEHRGPGSEQHHGDHHQEHTGEKSHHAPGPHGAEPEHHHDSAPEEPTTKMEEVDGDVEVVELEQPKNEEPELAEPFHEQPPEAELRRDFDHPEGPRHDGPHHEGPHHDGPHHEGPHHDGPESFEDDDHMMPPPPPPFSPDGPPHGPSPRPSPRPASRATSAAFSHRRHRSYSNAPWYKKIYFGPQYYQKLDDEEKEAMLGDCDSDCSSVEGDDDVVARDITQFRTAADVVGEMVAVEQGRMMGHVEGHSRHASSASMQQVFHHTQPVMPVQMNSVPIPISAEAAAMFPDLHQAYVVDEALPAYQEADRGDDDDASELASSLMADGYRPGGSYTPSDSGSQGASDILGDTKN
ncbi:hypothetical protein N0V93_004200 [Gnomoniopsis smithogilvyi]|uniref:Uncharacterized protein n=1 Tax=Gnomoniopsis smithogilvyi TaxID=1191159 RepID=A0A9W9CWW3_9PEZI|nr:hypothetical protein N0V93_004200 [Gnomoniopsis smithogilvyi]